MAENGRLYATPEEFFGREQNNGRHPHGGEGNCGGKEGHGTPELDRRSSQHPRNGGPKGGRQDSARTRNAKNKQNKSTDNAPKQPTSAPCEPKSGCGTSGNGNGKAEINRENVILGMKMAVILSEPLCRRNGMPAYIRNKRF